MKICIVAIALLMFLSTIAANALNDPGLEVNPGGVWNPWLFDPAAYWLDPPNYTQLAYGLGWTQITGGQQHGGNWAAKATGLTYGAAYEGVLAQLDSLVNPGVGGSIPLTGNTKYTLTYWVRNDDTLGNQWQEMGYGVGSPTSWDASWSRCLMGSYNSSGAFLAWDGNGCVIDTPVPQWTQMTLRFTTHPNAAVGYLVIQMHLNGNQSGASSMYFDDINLQTGFSGPIILNGGFETGNRLPWTTANAVKAVAATSNPHTGNNCIEVKDNQRMAPYTTSLLEQASLPLEPAKMYLAEAYYRNEGDYWTAETGTNLVTLSIVEGNTAEGYTDTHNMATVVQNISDWTRTRAIFTTEPDSNLFTARAYINLNRPSPFVESEKFFVDDWKIEEVDINIPYSIGAMKAEGAMMPGTISGIITGIVDGSTFYVESEDRSSAVLVETPDYPPAEYPSVGQPVTLKGYLSPALNFEYQEMLTFKPLEAPELEAVGNAVKPLASISKTLNSTASGASVQCMYTKVFGTVVFSDWENGVFTINDGAENIQVKYYLGYPFPAVGDYVSVTGFPVTHYDTVWFQLIGDVSEVQIIQAYYSE